MGAARMVRDLKQGNSMEPNEKCTGCPRPTQVCRIMPCLWRESMTYPQGIEDAYNLGFSEAGGDVCLTCDGDPESPRSRAYDQGRTDGRCALGLEEGR